MWAVSSRPSDQQQKKPDGRTCWAGSVERRLDDCWPNADAMVTMNVWSSLFQCNHAASSPGWGPRGQGPAKVIWPIVFKSTASPHLQMLSMMLFEKHCMGMLCRSWVLFDIDCYYSEQREINRQTDRVCPEGRPQSHLYQSAAAAPVSV